MRQLFLLCTLLSIILISCTDIYFVEPQPKGIKPLKNDFEELVGEYISVDEDSESEDTIKVTKNRIIFPEEDSMEDELGDMFVVKKYKNHYFLNFYNKEKNLWKLITVENYTFDSLLVINLTGLEQKEADNLAKEKFGKKVKIGNQDEYIVLDPSRRQLMRLLEYPVFEEEKMYLTKIKAN